MAKMTELIYLYVLPGLLYYPIASVGISISVYSNHAILNEAFKLTCEGQSDNIAISLKSKNYEGVGENTTAVFTGVLPNGTCKIAGNHYRSYTYSCANDSNIVMYNTTIPGEWMFEQLHLSIWWCTNPYTSNSSDEYTIRVDVPVSDVKLLPYTTEITENKTQIFHCETDPVRPNAIIQWYLSDGNNLTAKASQQPVCSKPCNDKIASQSNLSYIGKRNDHEKKIFCTASNIDGHSKRSNNVSLYVIYGPNSVMLSPSNSSYTVTETKGSIGPVTCTADCRPNCTMTWSGPNLHLYNTSILTLEKINRNQTGYYRCTAENIVSSIASTTVNVLINYGPAVVLLSPSRTSYTVEETRDSLGPITCTADCNPNCTMAWSGPHLSRGTKQLFLKNITRNQTGRYRCKASNDFGSTTSRDVTVNVHYAPKTVLLSPSKLFYTVTETTDSVGPITCIADCRPNCTMIWNGPYLLGGTESVLTLNTINRNQAGEYHCNASNSVDSITSAFVIVIVNYAPTIISIDGDSTFSENSTAEFHCLVDSVPKSLIEWKFTDGKKTTIFKKEIYLNYQVNGSQLTISQMSCLSMGVYFCKANNGIGVTQMALNVTVLCAPRLNIFEHKIQSIIAVSDNQPLFITAPVLAYPDPTVYWQFIRNGSSNDVIGELYNTTFLNNRHNYTLIIHNLTQENFGFYSIYAGNGIGMDINIIGVYEVQAARRPNQPSNITCIGGNNYVIVNWQPEFNGGSPQSFKVFYKNVLEKSLTKHMQSVDEADYHPIKIVNLPSMNMYVLNVHAENIYNSTVSEDIYCNTTEGEDNKAESLIAVGIGAGVGSALFVLFLVFAILFVFRRLRMKTSKNDKEPMKRSNEEEETDGLADNPLYVSSTDDVQQNVINSKVLKGEKQDVSQTKKKKKDKSNRAIEMGCVYENHNDFKKGIDQIHANQQDPINKTKEYKPRKNKDGLIYADLDLDPVSTERRFIIRGMDNRNNYALIDLSKKADPLPSDDENEENEDD